MRVSNDKSKEAKSLKKRREKRKMAEQATAAAKAAKKKQKTGHTVQAAAAIAVQAESSASSSTIVVVLPPSVVPAPQLSPVETQAAQTTQQVPVVVTATRLATQAPAGSSGGATALPVGGWSARVGPGPIHATLGEQGNQHDTLERSVMYLAFNETGKKKFEEIVDRWLYADEDSPKKSKLGTVVSLVRYARHSQAQFSAGDAARKQQLEANKQKTK